MNGNCAVRGEVFAHAGVDWPAPAGAGVRRTVPAEPRRGGPCPQNRGAADAAQDAE